MERKSGLLAYITALIPGVGYLYLGLKRKGLEALLLWILISPVLGLVGLGFLAWMIKLPLWFYTFFDTINMAARIDKGEFIPDSDFLFIGNIVNGNSFSDGVKSGAGNGLNLNNDSLKYAVGWGLVVLGGLALANRLLMGSTIYNWIRYNVNLYFVPVLFVLAGVYLLIRDRRK